MAEDETIPKKHVALSNKSLNLVMEWALDDARGSDPAAAAYVALITSIGIMMGGDDDKEKAEYSEWLGMRFKNIGLSDRLAESMPYKWNPKKAHSEQKSPGNAAGRCIYSALIARDILAREILAILKREEKTPNRKRALYGASAIAKRS